MKYLLYFLFLSLLLCSCDACVNASYQFTINYDRDVVVSKETINANIGKAIKITKEFDSRIYEEAMERYLYDTDDYNGYKMESAELYYFWLRLKGDYPGNFNFMESVLADCIVYGHTFPMTVLTFPEADDDSFKITEVGVFASNLGGGMENFSVVMSFVPKQEVDKDITLSWDFTFQYVVNLLK